MKKYISNRSKEVSSLLGLCLVMIGVFASVSQEMSTLLVTSGITLIGIPERK